MKPLKSFFHTDTAINKVHATLFIHSSLIIIAVTVFTGTIKTFSVIQLVISSILTYPKLSLLQSKTVKLKDNYDAMMIVTFTEFKGELNAKTNLFLFESVGIVD